MTTILEKVLQEYGSKDKCKIRDHEKVESILRRLKDEGPTKLQMITDFDHTLTRFHKDGQRCDTCHGILDNSSLMPDIYREKAKVLFEKYYNIEIDHKMTIEEKIPHMINWYTKSHELLVDYQVSKSKITEMVEKSRALLRDSACDVLSFLNARDVPVLIFSAGVGNMLEEVLRREGAFLPNVKVVSNYMIFDDAGVCTSFQEPLIHMFNKNETALGHSEYFQELSHRNNALVLGDSIGDLSMDNGMHNPGAILKIGFLNDKIKERMDTFVNSFDVVLVDDQGFKFVDTILRTICI